LKSLSQFSERAKLLLIVNGPLFAGIGSLSKHNEAPP
jgi:hypothetical protein